MKISQAHLSRDVKLLRYSRGAYKFAKAVAAVSTAVTIVLMGLDAISVLKK